MSIENGEPSKVDETKEGEAFDLSDFDATKREIEAYNEMKKAEIATAEEKVAGMLGLDKGQMKNWKETVLNINRKNAEKEELAFGEDEFSKSVDFELISKLLDAETRLNRQLGSAESALGTRQIAERNRKINELCKEIDDI